MVDRREFMASGIAVAALAGEAHALSASTTAAGQGQLVFVADRRFRAACRAAQEATALGAKCRALSSDLTPVYEWLDQYLAELTVPVAGLATRNTLFALERLSWDRGLRTVYRGIHAHDGEAARHEHFGTVSIHRRLDADGASDWGTALGRGLTLAAAETVHRNDVLNSQWLPAADDTSLVSWLLIPRRQVAR